MKIKSLLLGSAAAMVAVSGAQAADAIIVEPEPMEYVKVCDMYGAGYFYIPGTETCLKIGGHVRVEYSSTRYHEEELNTKSNHNARARGQLAFDAKNETELGTLSSNITFNMGWAQESNPVHDAWSASEDFRMGSGLTNATISLAGFKTGFTDGQAMGRHAGSGYYNAINDGLKRGGSSLFFEYAGSAGDFTYAVGIQDAGPSGASGQPDLYAGAGFGVAGFDVKAVVVYDTNGWNGDDGADAEFDGGIAYRVRADYDMSSVLPGAKIGAWWEADNGRTDYVKGHKWGVTAQAQLIEKWTLYGGYSAFDRHDSDNDQTDWSVGLKWDVVSGLYIQGEWNKANYAEDQASGIAGVTYDSKDTFTLRINRSF